MTEFFLRYNARTDIRPTAPRDRLDGSGIMTKLPVCVVGLNAKDEPKVVPPKTAKAVFAVKPKEVVDVSRAVVVGMIQDVSVRTKTGVELVAPT